MEIDQPTKEEWDDESPSRTTTVWAVAYTDRPDGFKTGGEKPVRMYLCHPYTGNPSAIGTPACANRFYERKDAVSWRDEMQEEYEEKLYLVKIKCTRKGVSDR